MKSIYPHPSPKLRHNATEYARNMIAVNGKMKYFRNPPLVLKIVARVEMMARLELDLPIWTHRIIGCFVGNKVFVLMIQAYVI